MSADLDFFCPCCNRYHSGFIPGGVKSLILEEIQIVGGGHRMGQKCPLCFCLDRERLVFCFLTSLGATLDNKQILHIAPERHVRRLLERKRSVSYFPGDLHPQSHTSRIDITKIPFLSNTFDLVVCNHVLEHILNDRLAMSELFRVLKPDGLAILQVPVSWKIKESLENPQMNTDILRLRAFGQKDHVRIYAKVDYISRLEAEGFTVKTFNFSKVKGISSARRHGINPEEELYLGLKSANCFVMFD